MTNMIVSEYAVVSGTNSDSFSEEVDRYLSKGWELHGGMNYQVTMDHHQWYAQAFVKKTKEENEANGFGAWG
jgi:hypothetical protein